MEEIANSVKFRDICTMLKKIKKAKLSHKEIIISRYYDSFCKHRESFRRQVGVSANTDEDGTSSFYSVLRILIPKADKAREEYGLQITALGKLYIRVLQLPPDSRAALRLQWRSRSSVLGDYGDIVHSVLAPRCRHKPSDLTLKQIHDMLDIIAKGDTTSKERELIRFSEIASAEEQMWLVRILLKSMSLGIGEQRIFGLLHPQAKDMYHRCSNLQQVCKLLADNKLVHDSNKDIPAELKLNLNALIEPFQHIRPMLCERFPGKIEQLMQSDVLYMETKMDGERFQLHFADGHFKFISRNGIDYTYSFGNSFDFGTYTFELRDLLPSGLQSIIIDGEMMVWDPDQKRYRDKGENTDVKHLRSDRNWRPCFVAYDLLYYNGKSLLDMIYVQRTYKLQELLKEKLGVLQVMRAQKIGSLNDFNRMFQEVLDSNAEGIVLKKQQSVYRPGQRFGGGWYKDKADYIKGLTTEFDLLIIGGFYNRTRTFIVSFLLGVLKSGNNQAHDEVYSVGKVANNKNAHTLNQMLKPHWNDIVSEPPPLWYNYKATNAEGRPDVWIEPKHSTILQVKAADLAPNSDFFISKSLHFARTEAWRNDKVWDECLTLHEYTQISEGKSGLKKITKRQLRLEDFTDDRKRQKLSVAEKRKLGKLRYEKRFDASKVCATSKLLKGFTFCILSAAPRRLYSKPDLQNLAAQHGGKIVENPLHNDEQCVCIAGDITYYVKRVIRKEPRTNNVLRMEWLLRVCDQQYIHLRPNDVLSMTDALRAQFAKSFDTLGDSYTDDVTCVKDLEELLDNIPDAERSAIGISESELAKLETKLMLQANPNFFRNHFACFYDTDGSSTSLLHLRKVQFLQHGGQYLDNFDDCGSQIQRVRYIFIDMAYFDEDSFTTWTRNHFPNSQLKNLQVVNIDWIQHSHQANYKLDINEYARLIKN